MKKNTHKKRKFIQDEPKPIGPNPTKVSKIIPNFGKKDFDKETEEWLKILKINT